eukprot:TRINITY_DN13138_c0_g1_i2.p1 TRINITY_DN13138_c0_g1~~TRINITY_DN13138_c0_g1_i2.p1  ORF type:complete len:119 (+),score=4.36 TRINITY_DN13138_c0_g1_i2:89-445(+)
MSTYPQCTAHKKAKTHSIDPLTGAHFNYSDIVRKLQNIKNSLSAHKVSHYVHLQPKIQVRNFFKTAYAPLMVKSRNDILYIKRTGNFSKVFETHKLSLIHICRCRRYAVCRSRWSPYH